MISHPRQIFEKRSCARLQSFYNSHRELNVCSDAPDESPCILKNFQRATYGNVRVIQVNWVMLLRGLLFRGAAPDSFPPFTSPQRNRMGLQCVPIFRTLRHAAFLALRFPDFRSLDVLAHDSHVGRCGNGLVSRGVPVVASVGCGGLRLHPDS